MTCPEAHSLEEDSPFEVLAHTCLRLGRSHVEEEDRGRLACRRNEGDRSPWEVLDHRIGVGRSRSLDHLRRLHLGKAQRLRPTRSP